MKKCLLVLGSLALAATSAHADTQGVTLAPGGTTTRNGFWTLGYSFMANVNITATSLSAWDDRGDGFISGPLRVGLWDSAGNLLASTFVDVNDPLSGDGFRSRAIAPVSLTAGSVYVVGAQNLSDNYYFNTFGNQTVAPEITWISDRFVSGAGLAFPIFGSGSFAGFYGGNFSFGTVVPVSPAALLGTGGLACFGVFGAIRRRRTAR